MRIRGVAAAALAATMVVVACSKKEEPAPQAVQAQPAPGQAMGQPGMPPSHPPMGGQDGAPAPAAPRQVVVPDEVKATWKSVVLAVTDRSGNTSKDVTIEIGGSATVGDLEIAVESFLPAFTMGEGNITSRTNETDNPAARLMVKEKGTEVFSGWLFSMYPDAHPFQHERYNVSLKDFVKK
ncbi:MAG: DUF2155 domain-containing protein [Deferrisomatales bacterium]